MTPTASAAFQFTLRLPSTSPSPGAVVDLVSTLAGREVTDPDLRRAGWQCALSLRRAADPAGTLADRTARRRHAEAFVRDWRSYIERVVLNGGVP